MFNYIQVKHTKTGDVLGQMLTFDSRDAYLLEFATQFKNAINNPDVIGLDIKVLDGQLNQVFEWKWLEEPKATPVEVEG